MTELLTLKEYQAKANSMDIPKSAFKNGKNRPRQGKKLKTKNQVHPRYDRDER